MADPMWTETEIAYAAGIFDGEGHAGIHGHVHRNGTKYLWLNVEIANTCLPLLNWLSNKFGGSIVAKTKQREDYRQVFVLYFKGPMAATFLEIVLPYLIVKKEVAQACIQFQSTISESRSSISEDVQSKRELLGEKVRRMNHGRWQS